jgi:hypothetical protein
MKTPHELITGFAKALNARDESDLVSIFSHQAVIRDGGLKFRGLGGVRNWIQTAIDRYDLRLKVLAITGHGQEWLFDAVVSGSFEGSPVRLEHSLTLEDGKIALLEI